MRRVISGLLGILFKIVLLIGLSIILIRGIVSGHDFKDEPEPDNDITTDEI